ncbi:hypothetical protein [Clostridium beijerinckii]|uniref:hypothetical protein n=1 Tax=Clostridium beijerinckii TaxID=1520 RepID=UPI00157031B3|nr:hypothetical protein [Clostridium beijerinckii]NRU52391.1 uncharacterized protein YuzB (UPF0349 family) [Clostridium beijerinckii]NRU52691.1 uncharacterized protein YuzB (UPF0349 family) [Clostridium beijerinckii]NYC68733.1 uncharacterized protein YuzB (UPF0349 family) [Clostridium beijerinckii]NYC91882.1 uncharacterized protein YuzB (UPF0349 family) [Clostridium beijerinckii]
MTLKEKILLKGFKDVYIESPNDKEGNIEYCVIIYFDFIWNKDNRLDSGKQEIEGDTEDEIMKNIDKFIETYSDKNDDWMLKLI